MKKKALDDVGEYVFDQSKYQNISYIYFMLCIISNKNERLNKIKIGISKSPDKRLRDLQVGNPHNIKLLYKLCVPTVDAIHLERNLHRKFSWSNKLGEWFYFHPIIRSWIKEHKRLNKQFKERTVCILRKRA